MLNKIGCEPELCCLGELWWDTSGDAAGAVLSTHTLGDTPTEHWILQESHFDSAGAAAGFQIHSMIQMEKLNYFPFSYCLNLWQATA